MAETDIQQTARFTREFVVMSLVPWMEKCALEWNENVRSVHDLCIVNGSVFFSVFSDPEAAITSVFFYAQIIRYTITLAVANTCAIFWIYSFVIGCRSQRRACPTFTNASLGRVCNCLG
jgi:hypothetical protein